jgi:hypothetical protein
MSKETFAKALQESQKGNWVPVMSIVRDDPQKAALVSKLNTAPNTNNAAVSTDPSQTLPDMAKLRSLSDRTAVNIADAETVMEVMPEMDLAKEILIGAIIAPKDMMTCELTYKGGDGIIAADIAGSMCAEIKEHFKNNYKIESQLAEILRDIFFRTGSWVYAVIPENSVDQMINGTGKITLESMSESIERDGSLRSRGLLGNAVKKEPTEEVTRPGLSLEAFDVSARREEFDPRVLFDRQTQRDFNPMVSVFDNPDALKIPSLHQRLREQRIMERTGSEDAIARAVGQKAYSAEHYGQVTQREIASQIFKNPQYGYQPMVRVHTQNQLARRAIGNPLVMHLPSESVMPVFVPGKPEEHIGYFVLLDVEGNPISKVNRDDQYRQLTNRFANNDSFASGMIGKVKNQIDGDFNRFNQNHLDVSARVFGELMEQELVMRLANSDVYSGGLEIAKQEEIYRIMLARRLAKQHTQLLFLPIELTTYFAVRHNENGIGVSILDRMKTLSSLRMMTMFANVAASMKNSIGRTAVNLKFDEDDPDPQRSFEIMVHEFMRTRQGALPVGLSTPADITDWMTKAGYEFTTEGNPMLPDVKIDVQQKSDSYIKPDAELEERLRKNHIMGFGVSPEQVDASYNADFATVANHNNLMLSKRALQHQETITPFLTEHHRKVIRNTEGLLRKLAEIVENNIDKIKEQWLKDQSGSKIDFTTEDGKLQKSMLVAEVLKQFIRSFEVALPAPNTASLTNQLAAMTEYEAIIDKALDAWIPREGLTSDTAGDVSSQFDALKALVKGHYMRKYMTENGIMPELADLTTKDENGKPVLDLYQSEKDHIQALSASMTGLLKALQPQKELANDEVQSMGGVEEPSTTDENSGGTEGENGGGTDEDAFQDFDLGGGSDNPLEAPADNTAPVEGEDPNAPEAEEPKSGGNTDDAAKDDQAQS